MTCQPLPDTGLAANLALLAIVAIACLALGVLVLLAGRSRRTRTTATVLMMLVLGGAVAFTPGTPARAASSDCSATGDNSLTITQTSVMAGLAPGVAPVLISGRVVNNGPDRTSIAVIDVAITSVSGEAGAAAGTCTASDYRITGRRMSVHRSIGPGGSTTFAGATIGFSNKVTNQDACKNAIVHLRYTTRE